MELRLRFPPRRCGFNSRRPLQLSFDVNSVKRMAVYTTESRRRIMTSELQKLVLLKSELDAEVAHARQRLEKATAELAAVTLTIGLLKSMGPMEEENTAYASTNIDFSGTRNLKERLERIAQSSGGLVNTSKAADIIIDARQTRSKKANIRSTIHRTLTGNKDSWEKIAPGTFRLRNGHRLGNGDD